MTNPPGVAPQVVVFLGSDTDRPVMARTAETLARFGVTCALRISSAHRTPERTAQLVKDYEAAGTKVFVCAAGMAAHLAGAVAAITTRPVIGVPMVSGSLGGLDALLSTVQMPAGVPVATVATGEAGATNAALLAVQVLALADPNLESLLREEKSRLAAAVVQKDEQGR